MVTRWLAMPDQGTTRISSLIEGIGHWRHHAKEVDARPAAMQSIQPLSSIRPSQD